MNTLSWGQVGIGLPRLPRGVLGIVLGSEDPRWGLDIQESGFCGVWEANRLAQVGGNLAFQTRWLLGRRESFRRAQEGLSEVGSWQDLPPAL